MLVKERMSYPVITVHPDMPIMDALNLMQKEHIRCFPVVDKRGRLVGIVSKTDMLHAAPSAASSLSVWEVNYLVSKITIKSVMTSDVITIEGDTPLEEAARIMADNKVGGLPVLNRGKVVGIVTETDLFKIFLEMLGAREQGIRLAILVPNTRGELAKLTKSIFDIGGNIISLGTFLGENSENREVTMKIEGTSANEIINATQPFVEKLIDIREI
ncbi:MAG TPA: CBS domain-containing protein [Chloroflexi bacterium]|nr:CBS domain-containing protein [Chloroflexota bacterium]